MLTLTALFQPNFCNDQGRKQPRFSRKKVAPNVSSAGQEFDDDPELSQELAQFSMMLKNQF